MVCLSQMQLYHTGHLADILSQLWKKSTVFRKEEINGLLERETAKKVAP